MAFGGPCNSETLTDFRKTWYQWSHRPLDPSCKIWLQSVQRGRGCACAKFAVRHLSFFFAYGYRSTCWTDRRH